jgi:eukaryotic-like serine/threonine-protein kinase
MSRLSKYILNPALEIIKREEYASLNISLDNKNPLYQQLIRQEQFLLSNKTRDKILIINPAIKLFLESFQTATLFEVALTHFSQTTHIAQEDALPVAESFFENMKERGVIVSLNAANKWLKKTTENHPQAGDIIDKYKILTPLSISGFIHVYLSENTFNSEKVVLKMLVLPDKMATRGRKFYSKRFHQEFELISEIEEHPHICTLLEWNKEGNYAILKYIEGESIRKKFENPITLSLHTRLTVFKQIVGSVAFVHHKKVIHGDIHASNFLINEDLQVTLIDFDLSNREKLKRGEVEWEGGIHEYLAPEKIDVNSFDMVKERADYCSEVFQLGVVFYYILYHRLPFEALSWKELIDIILKVEPPYPSVLFNNEPVSDTVIGFLKKMLSKNPKKRYPDAIRLLEAFPVLE